MGKQESQSQVCIASMFYRQSQNCQQSILFVLPRHPFTFSSFCLSFIFIIYLHVPSQNCQQSILFVLLHHLFTLFIISVIFQLYHLTSCTFRKLPVINTFCFASSSFYFFIIPFIFYLYFNLHKTTNRSVLSCHLFILGIFIPGKAIHKF